MELNNYSHCCSSPYFITYKICACVHKSQPLNPANLSGQMVPHSVQLKQMKPHSVQMKSQSVQSKRIRQTCHIYGCQNIIVKNGLCTRHGLRCMSPNCTSARRKGGLPFCQSHGGGKRCIHPNCHACISHRGLYCRYHGGGKKCITPGCENLRASVNLKKCRTHQL